MSYIKAIDEWYFACTAFIFASLLEQAIVGFFERKNLYFHMSGGPGPGPRRKVSYLANGRQSGTYSPVRQPREENMKVELTIDDCLLPDPVVPETSDFAVVEHMVIKESMLSPTSTSDSFLNRRRHVAEGIRRIYRKIFPPKSPYEPTTWNTTDKISIVAFPSFFLIFNAVYWYRIYTVYENNMRQILQY